MGERTEEALRVRIDTCVRLEFHAITLTSNDRLLACRELADALGSTEAATRCLQESMNTCRNMAFSRPSDSQVIKPTFKGYGCAGRFCEPQARRTGHSAARGRHRSASERAAAQTFERLFDPRSVMAPRPQAKTG